MFAAAMVTMLGGGLVRSCMSVTAGRRGGWKYTGVRVMFCVGCRVAADVVYRDVWHSAAATAAATLGCEAAGVFGTVLIGVYIGSRLLWCFSALW